MGDQYVADDPENLSFVLSSQDEDAAEVYSIHARKQRDTLLLSNRKHAHGRQKCDRIVADYWTYEMLGAFFCIGTLISIISVLFIFDNKPTPHAMAGLTLNTIISLLGTISRSSAVFVSTSVIAQQKWLHFNRKPQPLIQAVYYDDATRGPLGSLYLLRILRTNHVTLLAAIATVLALGFEAFIQQSVRFPLHDQLDSYAQPALMPIVKNVDYGVQETSTESKNFNASSYRHLYNLSQVVNTIVTQALFEESIKETPNCPGTKCNWPAYESAAYCSLCQDAIQDVSITPQTDTVLQAHYRKDYLNLLQFEDYNPSTQYLSKSWATTYDISLGQGHSLLLDLTVTANIYVPTASDEGLLDYPSKVVWDLRESSEHAALGFKGIRTSLWDNVTINGVLGPIQAFGYLELSPSQQDSRLAITSAKRCIISVCAQQYSSSVENNSLSLKVTNRTWGVFKSWVEWTAALNGSYFHGPGPYNISTNFIASPLSELSGSIFNSEDISGNYSASRNSIQFMSDIEGNCKKIAQGLTNFIQQNGDDHVKGHVYVATPYVQVRWLWLIFPVALVVIVLATLVTTMIQTKSHKLPLWRSSLFPLLYNFPTREDSNDSTVLDSDASGTSVPQAILNSEHEKMAKKTHIHLRSTAGSWVFEKTS